MAPLATSHRPSGVAATATTSFLVANLHCPSCVSTIQSVLQEPKDLASRIKWVSPNIVTSWVTIEHEEALPVRDMATALEEAGFEISSITSTVVNEDTSLHSDFDDDLAQNDTDAGHLDNAVGRWLFRTKTGSKLSQAQISSLREAQTKTHLENCEQCRLAHQDPEKYGDKSHATSPTAVESSCTADSSLPKSFVTVDGESDPTWRATLAVGGMTCAACANSLKDELGKRPWINSVAVNLIANSATVDFSGEEKSAQIVEAIEDIGFEATVDSVVNLDEQRAKGSAGQHRTIEVLIKGIYCNHCPERIVSSLGGFQNMELEIEAKPTKQRPILKITYVPQAPNFTIRSILAAIEATDPALEASIYHPPTLEERSKRIHARQQMQILIRVIFTFVAAIPTFIIGIVFMTLVSSDNPIREFLTAPWTSGISRAQISLFVMATPVYFLAADLFHRRAIKEIRSLWRKGSRVPVLQRFYRFGSMNMLMSLGTTIAYISSVCQLIAAAATKPMEVNDTNFYFDSVVFLTLFLLVGRLIEAYSKSRTGDAVEMLGKLRPTEATLTEQDASGAWKDKRVSTDMLDSGDVVRVPHGASPPCDGRIVEGETTFDESSLTGESRPVKRAADDEVFTGTINKGKPVLIRVTGVAGKSMLDQIVAVVREGQTKRAPMEKIADILTAYFVPVITLVAIITWIIWMAVGFSGTIPLDWLDVSSGGWAAFALQFAIAVFVVACPCGLALAAPTAIFVGGGLAAKYGILAKGGGEAFEKASRIDCVVFDKTGTLTVGGEPKVTGAQLYDGLPEDKARDADLYAALGSIEGNSSHPIARAVVAYCSSQTSKQVEVSDVEELSGRGMKANYSSENGSEKSFDIIVGNERLMKEYTVDVSPAATATLQEWKSQGMSVVLVATKPAGSDDYTLAGLLAISDPIRDETPAVIAALRARGTDVWMLSGDNVITARAVAMKAGIPETNVLAEVLPAQKAEKIKYLQSTLKPKTWRSSSSDASNQTTGRRATVAMVGDGINDAPALSAADVGIAVGSGADVAIASADFVLVGSDTHLASVLTLLDLSRAVFRRIKFNFFWALCYNVLAVPIAAGCLYPILSNGAHVRLDPVWASLAMALSSISVVLSSLALRSGLPGLGFRAKAFNSGANNKVQDE